MLTAPDKFSYFQTRIAENEHVIIKLTDGTTTWYVSDIDMQLSDGHVYPLLYSLDSIKKSANPFTKDWAVSDASVKIINQNYRKNSSGEWVKFSDEVESLQGNDAEIYFLRGSLATSLSDCLHVFSGIIDRAPAYDGEFIHIKIIDRGNLKNKILPAAHVMDDYTDCPNAVRTEKQPIVYGHYYQKLNDTDDIFGGVGLARGVRINVPTGTGGANFLICAHLSASYAGAYYDIGGEVVVRNEATSSSETGNTRIAQTNKNLLQYFGINDSPPDDYYAADYNPQNSANAHDGNTGSQAGVLDHLDDQYTLLTGEAVWGVEHSDWLDFFVSMQNEYINQSITPTLRVRQKNITWECNDGYGTGDYVRFYIYYSREDYISNPDPGSGNSGGTECYSTGNYTGDAACIFEVQIDADGTPDTFKWRKNSGSWNTGNACQGSEAWATELSDGVKIWFSSTTEGELGDYWIIYCHRDQRKLVGTLTSGQFGSSSWIEYGDFRLSDLEYNIDTALMVSIEAHNESTSDGDGTKGNFAIVNVGELDIGIWMRLIKHPEICWAALEGRMFGSWIDTGGRSNNYDEDDLIDDPAYIIESLMRDELSLATSEIDVTSFDAASNSYYNSGGATTYIPARLNLHSENEKSAYAAIRELCEQAPFMFMFSGISQARLIRLNDKTPTTDRVIHYSHIVADAPGGAPDIEVSKSEIYCNYMKLYSRWLQEYNILHDFDLIEDSVSQNQGIVEATFRWQNICGSASDYVAAHLVNSTDGTWSKQHSQIKFATGGFSDADLEVGDWIELHDDLDEILMLYGQSWSGKQFMIVEINQKMHQTEIKAIQLY